MTALLANEVLRPFMCLVTSPCTASPAQSSQVKSNVYAILDLIKRRLIEFTAQPLLRRHSLLDSESKPGA